MTDAPPVASHTRKTFRSLRTIIITATVFGLLIFLVSLSFELLLSAQIQQRAIANEQRLAAKGAADVVHNFIEEKFRILDQAADLNNLATKVDRRVLVTDKLLGRNPEFRQMFLLDAQGTELYKTSRLSLLSSDPVSQFKAALLADTQSGKRYISPVYIDPATNEPLVLIAVPANDIFREAHGAYVAEVNLKFMWDLVAHIQIQNNGSAYVVDTQGTLLAYKDVSLVLARKNVSALPIVHVFIQNGPEVTNDDFNAFSKGIEGTWVAASHAHLDTPNWAVVVETPIIDAYRPLIEILISLVLTIVISILAIFFLTTFVMRMIVTPIVRLRDATKEMSAGNFHTRVTLSSKSEIGQLADSFNAMAASLEELYKNLDTKVQEKTAELEKKLTELGTMNKLMVDRELKMIELKKEIKELQEKVLKP